ncbi:hypothetical protein M422DRAFT_52564 [Sphaerobolus stellatus SS14]|uniref:Uncharacterized protein n=1 Tax=Sphaerobolus stellatus (strain SS14) TaxID=990650 RepID=A0A0C9UE94_SPHS4|nr:hypothetical protein M422DRAFT_52564 [Sphaerobolus stellatus SS14]
MPRSYEIYIDQLATQLQGCPLWEPLHPKVDPVDIGDVGYLSENGGWIKLFNLREENRDKLPADTEFDCLEIRPADVGNGILRGPRYSKSVKEVGVDISVDVQSAKAEMSYQCQEERGAVLFIADDAVTREALNKLRFAKIMLHDVGSWLEFAKKRDRPISMKDLIFVTGYVRTTTWAATVFNKKSQSCRFVAGGRVPITETGATIELWGSLHRVNGAAWTGGPEE